MSLWQDEKYMRLLSPQLDRYTQKSTHHYNFRCPLCGDSEQNKYRARGYVYPKGNDLMFKCHNCSICLPFSALLRRQSRQLYNDYLLDRFKDTTVSIADTPGLHHLPQVYRFDQQKQRYQKFEPEAPSTPPDALTTAFDPALIEPLSALSEPSHALHDVYRYAVDTRKLPEAVLPRLFATNQAHTWVLPLLLTDTTTDDAEARKKAQRVQDGVPYLVQPFRLQNGTWFGAQLRTLDRKEYLTFRWSHEPLKMFGLEVWDAKTLTYVVEGPIDALFVPNCISPCGSDLLTGVKTLDDMNITMDRVFVWDNEPRNKEIVRHIRTAIKLNEKVVIWPKFEHKDINDMVRAGIDVNALLPKRTFHGLSADLEFSTWAK